MARADAPACTTQVKHGTTMPTASTSATPAWAASFASDPEKTAVTAPPARNHAAIAG